MDSSRSSLLLFTITTFSCIIIVAQCNDANNVSPTLSNICKGTHNPSLCSRTILEFLNSSSTFDRREALVAEVDATLHQTKKTIFIISRLLTNPSNSKTLAHLLTVCKGLYGHILDSINLTNSQFLPNNDFKSARSSLRGAILNQQGCENSFEQSPGVILLSPLHKTPNLYLSSLSIAMKFWSP